MKKYIIAAMIMALPFSMVNAQRGLISTKKLYTQKADINEYKMPGAVPEVGGKVIFEKDIKTEGKTKDQIYALLASFASLRFEPNSQRGNWKEPNFFRNINYAKVTKADKAEGIIEAQGAEEMIFSNKALSQDYTQVFYHFYIYITEGRVNVSMDQIAYVYAGSGDTTRLTAEEWITDKEALNKKGELRRINGKFRVKTIDLFNELADEIAEKLK